ncbi:hypothetical protein [Bacillus sp. FJAT-22090]|uniref:hypothetical protein n=1 Tax=Bacillus sp. FJAT-22090 TaxID=1581038 RepID=UPI0021B32023|nr:hypothetical protein [Bacillus sp. FJAT-22090]
MAEKTFINNTEATLQITIFVREGELPFNQDGTVSFSLDPGQTLIVPYGNEMNIFLNGIIIFTIFEGDLFSSVQFITMQSSELDDLLNTNDTITITKVQTDYVISGSDEFLDAVNAAQTVPEMRTAIENPGLGLDLTAYNALTELQKDQVASELLTNRPVGGYPTTISIQMALNAAINQIVDPNNIYVKAGAVGGDGSLASPLSTIAEGIAAVNPGGTVHILSGTYPITSQILVNKTGIKLLGEPGTLLILQADIIAMLITAPDTTIEGLTITSDIPYAKEFIQVGATNTSILNNTIYGPPQALPMANWIVNRAVVPQGGINFTVNGNTFYSLRTGIYINPNVTGEINNNVVYNTKGAFLVDQAFTTFFGNSWGTPANEVDIALFAGTTMGPPYDNLALLSAENNNATISDQR